MKVIYTSDLHGETRLYQELLQVATTSFAEAIALGGDLFPSFPPSKRYEDMIPNQIDFIVRFLLPFFEKIKQTTTVKRILTIPGNWDLGYPFLFANKSDNLVDLNQRSYRFDNGYELIGYPFVPPTPFRPKEYEKMDDRDSPWPPQKNPSYIMSHQLLGQIVPIDPSSFLRQRGTIQDDLSHLVKPVDFRKSIYVMHSPPFGTPLDQIQDGTPAGSRSVKEFIQENQPLLTLHGHIHESPTVSGAYVDRIGETLCVNPGQISLTGQKVSRLSAVTFEMENPEATLVFTPLRNRDE
jgi:uncharacterized protein